MTVARPVAAFISAFVAGTLENLIGSGKQQSTPPPLPMASVIPSLCNDDHCGCRPDADRSLGGRFKLGMRYAVNDIWGDLAGWFFIGIAVAAAITVLVPDDVISRHLGGGLDSMLLMLLAGVPMYICATASTPIAAAMILKGVSPGAALVFLLAGPATNIAALAVLVKILGKKGVVIYLISIAVISVLCGLILDSIYFSLGLSAVATIGQVSETVPHWLMVTAALVLLLLSLRHLLRNHTHRAILHQ